jgi:hypothetical protein
MCGRVRLSTDVSEIKLVFSIPPHRPTTNIAASWNVAPTDPLPVVRYDTKAGERSLDVMRWGLVPFWAKDMKVGFSNINAMAETVDTKPAFREAFQRRRRLVPVDNFYEWKKTATGKRLGAAKSVDAPRALNPAVETAGNAASCDFFAVSGCNQGRRSAGNTCLVGCRTAAASNAPTSDAVAATDPECRRRATSNQLEGGCSCSVWQPAPIRGAGSS